MNLEEQGWLILENEERLIWYYPKHEWGTYRPQPYFEPESYPCWFKEIAVIDNANGPDFCCFGLYL